MNDCELPGGEKLGNTLRPMTLGDPDDVIKECLLDVRRSMRVDVLIKEFSDIAASKMGEHIVICTPHRENRNETAIHYVPVAQVWEAILATDESALFGNSMVGDSGLEPETSTLSVSRSNQLS